MRNTKNEDIFFDNQPKNRSSSSNKALDKKSKREGKIHFNLISYLIFKFDF